MFQQNHLVSWIIHVLSSWENLPILPTLKINASENIENLNDPLFFLNSTHLLVFCSLLRLKQKKTLA